MSTWETLRCYVMFTARVGTLRYAYEMQVAVTSLLYHFLLKATSLTIGILPNLNPPKPKSPQDNRNGFRWLSYPTQRRLISVNSGISPVFQTERPLASQHQWLGSGQT